MVSAVERLEKRAGRTVADVLGESLLGNVCVRVVISINGEG